VDEDVKNGIVQPGQYLILELDFASAALPHSLEEYAQTAGREINIALSKFKRQYTKYLGQSFALETSDFIQNDPSGNLRSLVVAVDGALQDIHARGDKDHPLWDVQGVCLF
jgi:hypothetical protein